jgi:hypothetical protein
MFVIGGYLLSLLVFKFVRGKKHLTIENMLWIGFIYAWVVGVLIK